MDLILGATVQCMPVAKQHRHAACIVARCAAGGADLSANMVHTGWALAKPDARTLYGAIEAKAEKRKHGLWGRHLRIAMDVAPTGRETARPVAQPAQRTPMQTDEFDFELPRLLIAQHPLKERDSARLLEVGESLQDRHMRDLPQRLRTGDILVVNDTRVIPARLTGRRGQAKIELTLHRRLPTGAWRAFARPARRLKPDDRVVFGPGFHADVVEKHAGGEITIRPNLDGPAFSAALAEHGRCPCRPISNARTARRKTTGTNIKPSTHGTTARLPRRRRVSISRLNCSKRLRPKAFSALR